jgi:hypothetical protein
MAVIKSSTTILMLIPLGAFIASLKATIWVKFIQTANGNGPNTSSINMIGEQLNNLVGGRTPTHSPIKSRKAHVITPL